MATKFSNPFWREVFLAWNNLLDTNTLHKYEALACPLWYNPQISLEPLFLPRWYYAGIHAQIDLLDDNNTILELEELKRLFNLKGNFLEHIQIKRCLKQYMGNFYCSKNSSSRPYLPPYLKLLTNSTCASFYNIFNKQYINVNLKTKWDTILNINLAEKDWTNI